MMLSNGSSLRCGVVDFIVALGVLPLAGGVSETIDVWLRAWSQSANTLKRSFDSSPPRCAIFSAASKVPASTTRACGSGTGSRSNPVPRLQYPQQSDMCLYALRTLDISLVDARFMTRAQDETKDCVSSAGHRNFRSRPPVPAHGRNFGAATASAAPFHRRTNRRPNGTARG